ncbi:MAG: sigma-70 family RNA polymerase sigma factor [Bacteroidales bacterium]|nr:sigma-70 family RNA polymerase sigma factor [Bacteroidales bacterium]
MNISNLINGNKKSWNKFVNEYSPLIYSAVLKIFHAHTRNIDEYDVKDAVQEIFIKLIKNDYQLLKNYNPSKASLSTWLTIVSRSTTLDFLKHRQLETISLNDIVLDISEQNEFTDFSIDIPSDLLSSRQKLILKLFFDKKMETSEIAELLNINVQTVRSTKHKALIKLRKLFDKKPKD